MQNGQKRRKKREKKVKHTFPLTDLSFPEDSSSDCPSISLLLQKENRIDIKEIE